MKIALLGDIALFGQYSLESNDALLINLKPMAELLSSFDYVIGNLETPFVSNQKKHNYKSAHICSKVKNIEILKFLHINCVSLANNHIFDYGKGAYKETKKLLESNNIDYVGVEDKEVFIEKNDNKIAINGFCCYSTNPLGLNKKGVNRLDYEKVFNVLKKNSLNNYNNITSIHAGEEHVNYPNIDHVQFARYLAENVDFIYYGHHPHVLQGIEKWEKTIIAYSLGNFCFDNVYDEKGNLIVEFGENSMQSIILSLEYKDNKLVKNDVIPIYQSKICNAKKKELIIRNINNYSNSLKLKNNEYIEIRQSELNKYLKNRREKNLKWFIKKININSFMIIINFLRNKRKYSKYFKSHILLYSEK
jgi:poly-gamma-glutamate synthesis protein (capsule biosynthesis protein)